MNYIRTPYRTFILCAGSQKRFGSHTPKQLMSIHGKPLLYRTIKQVDNPIIVTNNQPIIEFCEHHNIDYLVPENNKTVCNTLLSTQHLWLSKNIVLLGDVYYNETCLDQLYNYNKPLCVSGNGVEIFGLSFKPHTKIIESLEVASNHKLGKLWNFYRVYSGIPIDSHKRDNLGIYCIPNDYTDDIDTLEEYHKLKARVEK